MNSPTQSAAIRRLVEDIQKNISVYNAKIAALKADKAPASTIRHAEANRAQLLNSLRELSTSLCKGRAA